MRCDDVAEQFLERNGEAHAELDQHVAGCQRCAHVARGMLRLDAVLATTLVVMPPLDLQRQLQQLVVAAAAPQPVPWWRRAIQGDFNFDWMALRPNMVAAQGLAAVMVALASWQVFGWMSAFQPVIGDVPTHDVERLRPGEFAAMAERGIALLRVGDLARNHRRRGAVAEERGRDEVALGEIAMPEA